MLKQLITGYLFVCLLKCISSTNTTNTTSTPTTPTTTSTSSAPTTSTNPSYHFKFNCTRNKVDVFLVDRTIHSGILYVKDINKQNCSVHLSNQTNSNILTIYFNQTKCNSIQHNDTFTVVYRAFMGDVAISEIFADIRCYEGNEYRGQATAISNLGVNEGNIKFTVNPKTFPPIKAPNVSLTFVQNGRTISRSIAIGKQVELQLNVTDDIHKLSPVDCTAHTKTGNKPDQLVLSSYCPYESLKDVLEISHTESLNKDQSAVSFKFNAFRLGQAVTAQQEVSFTCMVQICGKNDGGSLCDLRKQATCTAAQNGRRRKRSLEDERGVVQVTQRLTVYDSDLKKSGNTLSTSAVATIGSSAGAVFILLSAFFIVLAVRIRRRRQKKADEFAVSQITEVSQTPVGDRFVTEEKHHRKVGLVNSAFENNP